MARELKAIVQHMAEFRTLQQRHEKAQESVVDEDAEIHKHGIAAVPPSPSKDAEPELSAGVGVEAAQAFDETTGAVRHRGLAHASSFHETGRPTLRGAGR